MQNTFDNAGKAERRKAERQRQIELMNEATLSGRSLPTFLDEDGSAGGSVYSAVSSSFPIPAPAGGGGTSPDNSATSFGSGGKGSGSGSSAGDDKDEIENGLERHSFNLRSRSSSSSSVEAMEKNIADGMHAAPLGATDAAQKFLWDEDGDESNLHPAASFGSSSGNGNANNHPSTPPRTGGGIGAKLLRGLVPTFGPDGGRGGGGGSSDPRTPSPLVGRSQSARAFRLAMGGGLAEFGGGGGGGNNLAPRREAEDLMTNVDLSKTPTTQRQQRLNSINLAPGQLDSYHGDRSPTRALGGDAKQRGGGSSSRYAGYDDDNLPPVSWADSAGAGASRAGRTLRTAFGGCCTGLMRREVKTAMFFALGVAITAAIAFSVTDRNGGGGEGGGPPGAAEVQVSSVADRGGNLDPARLDAIVRRVVDSGASLHSELSPSSSSGAQSTPQRRAAEWLAGSDARMLDPEDDFLLQRYALAVLWYGTHDDDGDDSSAGGGEEEELGRWVKSDGWMSDEGLCSWHGITCHELGSGAEADAANTDKKQEGDGMVSSISLEGNNVLGDLPREVFTCLIDLTELNLHGNELGGTIDATDVGRLRLLQNLDLGDNSITGTVPTEIGKLDNLVTLDLGQNLLEGSIPEEIADLFDTLVECSLFGNDLTGTLPESLAKLEKLESLYLDGNDLTGTIPPSWGRDLVSMIDLRVRDNALMGPIPPELGLMTDLEVLYIDTNDLTGTVPPALSELLKLAELNLYDNLLTGTLPPELALLAELRHAYLDNNEFTGSLPSTFGNLKNLINLYVDHNRLTGSIPTDMGSMTNMEILSLGSNELVGTIPEELGQMEKLTELGLEDNRLEGQVPESLGQVVNIETLLLHGNSLTGKMPDSVCQLVNDHELDNLTAPCLEAGGFLCECCSQCY